MQQMVNGRVVDVPLNNDGSLDSDTLREVAAIPKNRTLVQQLSSGENILVNPGQRIRVNPSDYFRDVPDHIRGKEKSEDVYPGT
ncbi:hypothetical protein [Bythopirellula polymerisocia]|uniref:Uncharacterized protein n=1 Tax=Bythopirellula polymerisocia TaxID=2528003 RepID=A0A5C6CBD3_9BACT|nr:hypothetical protein [Bythopirellula polymerisocia]TWU20724.1 hypothetical protein Pla144_48910 [Bythopirellula polymerisocia]